MITIFVPQAPVLGPGTAWRFHMRELTARRTLCLKTHQMDV